MVFIVIKYYFLCYEFDINTWDVPNTKETLPKFQHNLNELVKWIFLNQSGQPIEFSIK